MYFDEDIDVLSLSEKTAVFLRQWDNCINIAPTYTYQGFTGTVVERTTFTHQQFLNSE